MNPQEDLEPPLQINIVPMIDVIFAILAFFIISTLYLTRAEGLPVNLPKAKTSESQTSRIVVTIDAKGELAINQQAIPIGDLEESIQTLADQTEQKALVVINADEQVSHGRVVEVMDLVRDLDGVRLAVRTKKVAN